MRCLNLILLLSFSVSQDLQVKYVSAYTVDFDWGGEVESVIEVTAARGYLRFNGKLNPKRWIFRLFGGERGIIIIAGNDNSIGYNAKRERYWVQPYGSMNIIADMSLGNPSKGKSEETSTTQEPKEKETSKNEEQNPFIELINAIFNDDTATPQIERVAGDGIEIVNGFRTNKWTSTITTESNKLVIEEWMVDRLPLRDSLYSYLSTLIESDTVENFSMPKFSSHDIIKNLDSTYAFEPSNESIVLAKLLVDSDDGWIQSASFEIRELYTVPFDASSFTIPEEYERIEVEEEEPDLGPKDKEAD
tara:strand:- start:168 stop:1079 length:912 start_codon:yes stop_codon:yes gene_type:complete